MQKVADGVVRRWRSGCAGKVVITSIGLVLGCCLCSVPMALVDTGAPAATRDRTIENMAATDRAELQQRKPTSTPWVAPPDNPPTTPPDTPVPVPAPTNTAQPPPSPAARGGGAANPFTCAGGCSDPPDPSCAIKGNISQSSGEKIYHVPGQRNYDDTEISPEFGERWFCTPAEAEAAGWRAAKR
jgi:hypothetical protein